MSRLLAATLLTAAEGTSGPLVSFYCVNACDDGSQNDYCVSNSTAYDGCQTAPAGCHVMAWQTLYNEGTCEAFMASKPLCFDQGHGADSGRCPEAATFQLIMDRNRDLDRTYAAGDFYGVAKNLYQSAGVFAQDFAVTTDVEDVYKAWATEHVNLDRVSRKVLQRDFGSDSTKWAHHELGSWADDNDVARYTRWVYSGEPYGWQIETDVDAEDTGNEKEPGDFTDAIRERYAAYKTQFQAGNFKSLVADFYTSDAVVALLTAGVFVEHEGLENYLSGIYDEEPDREFSVSTAAGKDGADVVHDVGMITSSSQKYYARWEKCGDEWKIAVQVEVRAEAPLPPHHDASCAAHAACSMLEGNCCPTDAGVTLDCCAPSSCSSHPGCAILGLVGNCCPDDAGLTLDCCRSSSVLV